MLPIPNPSDSALELLAVALDRALSPSKPAPIWYVHYGYVPVDAIQCRPFASAPAALAFLDEMDASDVPAWLRVDGRTICRTMIADTLACFAPDIAA